MSRTRPNPGRSAFPKRSRKGESRVSLLAIALILASASSTRAWDASGHRGVSVLASRAAAGAVADIPDFFFLGGEQIATASLEPDLRRDRALDRLRSTEGPEHYIDLEYLELEDLEEQGLPETRFDFLGLLGEKGLLPARVGFVPYAIIESMQKLTLAFAEYRADPDDGFLRAKVLHSAGILSHYAADMSQPLHTTIHFDGWALPDKRSPHTGIHDLVDSLIERAGETSQPSAAEIWPRPFKNPWEEVIAHLEQSHALVARVYELEDDLDWDRKSPRRSAVPAEVGDFARERQAAAVVFTARLFATAWVKSAELELPDWRFDPAQVAAE